MWKKIGLGLSVAGVAFVLLFALALWWPAPRTDGEFTITYNPSQWPEIEPESEYQTRNGDSLPLRVYRAEESDTVLILLHGISLYGYYFDEMATYLAKGSVATVYAPDLRGHGYGMSPRGHLDYEDQLVDDIADLVAHVRQEMPEARIVVGGHSAGGGLVVRLAGSDQAEGVDGYLLIAPALGIEAPSTNEDFGGLIKVRLPRLIGLSLLNGIGLGAMDGLDVLYLTYPDEVQRERQVLTYSWRYTKALTPSDYQRDLESIEAPLLLVAGDEDEIFNAEYYPSIIENHAPHGQVVIKAGFNHFEDIFTNRKTLEVYASWLKGLK